MACRSSGFSSGAVASAEELAKKPGESGRFRERFVAGMSDGTTLIADWAATYGAATTSRAIAAASIVREMGGG